MSKLKGDPGYRGGWCVHYRATSEGNTCEADVAYVSLGRPWPCFLERGESKRGAAPCDKLRRPTAEEMAAHDVWSKSRMETFATVMVGIAPWRQKHKDQSHTEVIECPACKGVCICRSRAAKATFMADARPTAASRGWNSRNQEDRE